MCGTGLVHGKCRSPVGPQVSGTAPASLPRAASIPDPAPARVQTLVPGATEGIIPHSFLPPGFNGLARKTGESAEVEPTALPTPAEREAEARFVSTAPTLKILNHHPLLEDLLHEAFLKKDYLAQAPFLPAAAGPLLPAGALQPAPGPPEPEPSPRTPALPRPAFPTDPLTTPAGRPGPWGEAWGAVPGADPSWSPSGVPESSTASPSQAPTTAGTSLAHHTGATVVPGDEEGTTTTSTITTTTVTTLQGPGENQGGSQVELW